MKKLTIILITILAFKQFGLGQIGKIAICPQFIYEEENSYFPHDYFIEENLGELLDESLSLEKVNDKFVLTNVYNNEFTGHEIIIEFNDKLEIYQVDYDEWSDMINGSETNYTVENIIISTNENPSETETQGLVGHYTLLIREDFKAGQILKNEGVNDTTYYSTFNGKFKVYNDKERSLGLEWVESQNELRFGLKDSLNIYDSPDEFAEYLYGDEELKKLLNKYKVQRSETKLAHKVFISVSVIVDENGKVNPNSMTILDEMNSERILDRLKQDEQLLSSWIPGKRKGKAVKSRMNLTIMVNE
jgi:hypothetical protein